jgi:hypothetical protein
MKKPFVVISYGGCGSKFLVRQISNHIGHDNYNAYHSHQRLPDKEFIAQYEKVIFIFGNPIDSVKSFFGRRLKNTKLHSYYSKEGSSDKGWAKKHCKNLKGDFNKLDVSWTLHDYLNNGQDLFLLEDFFSNWVNNEDTAGVFFIKYEKLWEYKNEIQNYLGFDDSFATNFEKQQQRSSTIDLISEKDNCLASDIYGGLANTIAKMNDYWVQTSVTSGGIKKSDNVKK